MGVAGQRSFVGGRRRCDCCEKKWRHERMRYERHKLLSYEVIEKAVAGEPEAVNAVLQHYTGYIKYLSYFQGRINDEIQEQLKSDLLVALFRFRFDR